MNVRNHYNKPVPLAGVWRLASQSPPLSLSGKVQEQGTFVHCRRYLTTASNRGPITCTIYTLIIYEKHGFVYSFYGYVYDTNGVYFVMKTCHNCSKFVSQFYDGDKSKTYFSIFFTPLIRIE